jgi:tellurite resistance protein
VLATGCEDPVRLPMQNPFVERTRTILAGAQISSEAAENLASEASAADDEGGVALTLAESIGLALVARHVAAADGLSEREAKAMRGLLDYYRVPEPLHEELLGGELEGAMEQHVKALIPAGSVKARLVISGAAFIAASDGLSSEELGRIRGLGAAVGISAELVEALIAESEVAVVASVRGDSVILQRLDRLRAALFRLA